MLPGFAEVGLAGICEEPVDERPPSVALASHIDVASCYGARHLHVVKHRLYLSPNRRTCEIRGNFKSADGQKRQT